MQYINNFHPQEEKGMIRVALGGYQPEFLIGIGLSLLAGFLIGAERESRGKPAGISTHCFVVAGTMMFTYISAQVDPTLHQE
ncbi:MAG TPA: MgtC/SapB family protein [Nitrososphaeraceae archaeon]|nr:MgtC/SapB family protein [Nitrososphaeraceae archaeon]